MTAIGPVPPGLPENQLLGNQSIFDLENWLLAPPSLTSQRELRSIKDGYNSHRLLEWAPLSPQPKNTQAQWSLYHFRRKEGTGVSFNTTATAGCRGVSFMTSQSSSSEGVNSLADKSHFLCFFLSPERSQTLGLGRQYTSPFYCFEDETRWFWLVEVYIHQDKSGCKYLYETHTCCNG